MVAPRERTPASLLLALAGLLAVLCLLSNRASHSALRASDGVGLGSHPSVSTAPLERRHGRRLQDEDEGEGGDLDADGEEAVPMDGKEASSSFDPDEDAGVVEELEAAEEQSVGPVDVDQDFEAFNTKAEDESTLFALQKMKTRLKPRGPLDFTHIDGDPNSQATKQFAHLHHMKTGGTSMNRVISCAVDRAKDGDRKALPFFSLSECGQGRYKECTEGTTDRSDQCRAQINSSAIMQFCAPLFTMDRFGWLGEKTEVITVLRDPVSRVWSMFRFQTKMCYHCKPLLDIYQMIDDGTIDNWCDAQRPARNGMDPEKRGCEGICMPQLLNHHTRNLMTTAWESPEGMAMSDQERLDEALHNLRTNIAVVGITEELPTFRDMVGQVFPWMAETVADDFLSANSTDASEKSTKSAKKCPLPHANASPRNNHCGEDGKSHWDLPDHPDPETVEAILRHNQLDVKLYEAAVEMFELQKHALGIE